MKTWFNIFPIFLFPFVLAFFPGLIPSLEFLQLPPFGHMVRVWFVDTLVLPLLSNALAWELAAWYQQAGVGQQVFVHFIVSLNLTALFSPLLYVAGNVYLAAYNTLVLAQFKSKRKAAQ